MNWFTKLFARQVGESGASFPPRPIIPIESSNLTLAEWVKHPELILEAKNICAEPTFKLMLDTLKNESPANYKMPKGSQPTDLITHLGEIDGYNMAINNMLAMTVKHEQMTTLEASFAPIEEEKT